MEAPPRPVRYRVVCHTSSQELLSQHHFIRLTAMEEQEESMSREYHIAYKREAGTYLVA
jgi:hypothetical protein